ncbi:unnamed protein product, partial [Timema podura]|nr:unnamed protein product [Timema podura]
MVFRRHIDFVPGIVNEMWDIMGESGKAVHKSILWIIEAIKTSYQKAVAFINGILKGESSEQISEIFQGFVQKYDKNKNLPILDNQLRQNDSRIADNLTTPPILSSFQPKTRSSRINRTFHAINTFVTAGRHWGN